MNTPSLHHVSFIVSDITKADVLYGKILGLPSDERPDLGFPGLFYQLGHGQQLHLMQLDNPDAASIRPYHGGRYRHLALAVSSLADIQHKLDGAGLAYTLSASGRAALFCYDFDGNSIEVIQINR